jgi:hypothetical protein
LRLVHHSAEAVKNSALRVAVAALVVSFAGCGAGTSHGPLSWSATPQVFQQRDLPSDRILLGQIHNASKRTLRIPASTIRIRDAKGHVLESSAGFVASYAHGLFGAFQQPSAQPVRELLRLGRLAILQPGATSPLFAAWRLPANAREPVSIDYGNGKLPVPTATRPTAP